MAFLGNSLKSGVFPRTYTEGREEIIDVQQMAYELRSCGLQIDDISHLMNTDRRQISQWLEENL